MDSTTLHLTLYILIIIVLILGLILTYIWYRIFQKRKNSALVKHEVTKSLIPEEKHIPEIKIEETPEEKSSQETPCVNRGIYETVKITPRRVKSDILRKTKSSETIFREPSMKSDVCLHHDSCDYGQICERNYQNVDYYNLSVFKQTHNLLA